MKKILKLKYFSLLFLVGFTLFLGTTMERSDDIYDKINKNMDVFGKVYKEVALNYVDEIDADKFVKAGIEGMLGTLDPYTTYYDENSKDQIDLITAGKYGGIGVTIGVRDSTFTITDVMNGYEAQKKGLRIGDKIIELDGKDLRGVKYESTRLMVRGPVGTNLNVKVDREGDILNFDLTRQEIILKVVSYYGMLEPSTDGIGYIRLDRFTNNALSEVENALKTFKASGNFKGLVLDLRNNGGGLLDAAIGILNKLVDKNSLLLITKGKETSSEKKYFSSEEPIVPKNVPVVVLTNENTASASEIVAGAVQDLDRGVIVGTKSFGKGLVQQFRDLTNDKQMKITTSKYFTPSGRWIQQKDYFQENKFGVFLDKDKYNQSEFKTLGGRTVYAKGGIAPDIEVKVEGLSDVYYALLSRDMFFKYANDYLVKNPDLKTFKPTDDIFIDFKEFIKTKNFDYVSNADKKIDDLRKLTEGKNFSPNIADYLNKIQSEVASEETTEVENAKEEIKKAITEEINKRLINEKEQIAATFEFDKQLQEAIAIINNPTQYNQLLGKY
ncbi:MAG: PDZ domain-containing protein [Ignavibacteria bacterium]|nr:PDZ domain-containing protein [Ignavibacteria bacterium]